MSEPSHKGYTRGTHRAVTPEQTFERITPQLRGFGITRCADVTGLDHLGIPVFVSVRPQGRILQVSNGKGLRPIDAKVSALMESIECWHVENPPGPFVRASARALEGQGARVLDPRRVPGFWPGVHWTDDTVTDWVRGEDLCDGSELLLPAFAGYYYPQQHCSFSWNGLASGNTLLEATLHGLYEVLERDTLSRLVGNGQVAFRRCDVLALNSVSDPDVGALIERIEGAGLRVVLLRAPSPLPVHTFVAALLDPRPFASSSTVNVGYGAHPSVGIAAMRALTEAAQSRLTFIHAAREDLPTRAYQGGEAHQVLFDYFSALPPDTGWHTLEDFSTPTLSGDYERVLGALEQSDLPQVFRIDLGRPGTRIAVAKVVVPGSRFTIPI